MKIGILSDSHGVTDRLMRALELFSRHGAEALIHCGDLTAIAHLKILADFEGRTIIVAGNMDKRKIGDFRAAAKEFGAEFSDDYVTLDLGKGKCLAATHGHLDFLLNDLVHDGRYSYVCCGHTHRQKDTKIGPTRLINPGALYSPSAGEEPSIAILDTENDTLERFSVS